MQQYSDISSPDTVCQSRIFSYAISCVLFLSTTSWVQPVSAFESPEHKTLGDNAMRVVTENYCYGKDANNTDTGSSEICEVLKKINSARISYGDIVLCVDYFLTPEKMISMNEDAGKHMISVWPTNECNGNTTKMVQASHSNHTHFQKELLISQDTYHLLASSLVGDKHNLVGGLYVNAISDHYLQDYFAPGHITVRRDKITDLFANALHDGANRDGATYHLKGESGQPRLKQTIADIRALSSKYIASDNVKAGNNINGICDFLLGSVRAAASACALPDSPNGFESVTLKGDGLLGRDDGYEQRMVMLAANVISIEDVLKSYKGNHTHTYYGNYEFHYQGDSNAFKYYLLAPFSEKKAIAYVPDILAKQPFGYYALGSNPDTQDSHDKLLPFSSDIVWGASIAEEQFSSGDRVTRTATTLEMVPFGRVGNGFFENYGIAVGLYQYGGSGDVTGRGVTARLGFIVPVTESTFSLGVRHVLHTNGHLNEWGSGWNVRFDQGFTSFLSLFVAAGRDFEAGTGSELFYGNFLSVGVMVAAPTGRIKSGVRDLLNFNK